MGMFLACIRGDGIASIGNERMVNGGTTLNVQLVKKHQSNLHILIILRIEGDIINWLHFYLLYYIRR